MTYTKNKECFMDFSSEDKNILNSYKRTISDLAKLFGSNYEFVLHSLENIEECVVAIENGHISGRSVGAPITNTALELVHKSNNDELILPYTSVGVNSIPLKCITTPIYNNKKLIGLLCVNINLNMKVTDLLHVFQTPSNANVNQEFFSTSVEDMMTDILQKVETDILQDSSIPYQDKNKSIIFTLDEKGFFRLRGSVEILAEHLKISPHTIYANLRKK